MSRWMRLQPLAYGHGGDHETMMFAAVDKKTVVVVVVGCKNQDTCPNKPCKRRGRGGTRPGRVVKRCGCRASTTTLMGSAQGS